MSVMFWVWLGIIVVTAIVEIFTMELVSIWFTIGAIIPFIFSGTTTLALEWQILIFVAVSAILMLSLRGVTKKFLLKNAKEKTNLDLLVGKKVRMLERTDFETMGSVKINDVVWSAVGEHNETIEKDEIVEVVKISGNKVIVKKIEDKRDNRKETGELVETEEKKKSKKEEK